jgi:hypothetical protein
MKEQEDRYWEEDFSRESVTAKLTRQRDEYRRELRDFWLKEVPPIVITIVVVLIACGWLMQTFFGDETIQGIDTAFALKMIVLGIAAIVPPIAFLKPKAPTEQSVAYGMLLNQIGEAVKRNEDR